MKNNILTGDTFFQHKILQVNALIENCVIIRKK